MIDPSGTFDYFGIAPSRPLASDWNLSLRLPTQIPINPLTKKRLVGHAPKLRIEHFGQMPSGPPWPDFPDMQLSLITLIADKKNLALAPSASFFLVKEITDAICPGDHLHITRSSSCGLAISLIRDNVLIFAIGAITMVPLSDCVQAWVPADLVEEAEAIFKKHDPQFSFKVSPVAIKVRDELRFLYDTNQIMSDYVVFLRHGVISDIDPGIDECAAISLLGSCSAFAAKVSAYLLKPFFEIDKW